MKDLFVSIIIPVFNTESYLEECLESVLGSEKIDNLEIIVINDGSTDGSLDIIQKYLKKYKNIILINQKNQGQGVARNKGLEVARGQYIYFLDSDDFIEKDSLTKLFVEAKTKSLDLLMFNGSSFIETDNINNNFKKTNYIKNGSYPHIETGLNIFSKLIKNKDYTCSPCLYIVRRDFLVKTNIRFYEGVIHEDELFTFKLMMESNRVKVIDENYFYRRIRPNSTMTGQNYEKSLQGFYVVLKEMLKIESDILDEKKHLLAIETKMSYMYGSILNAYSYMEKEKRANYRGNIKEIKKIGKEKSFFNRMEYGIFNYSEIMYLILRKTYDRLLKLKNL